MINRIKRKIIKISTDTDLYQSFYKKNLGTLVSVDVEERLAALTFDGGPHPIWTPKVLKILEKFGAKATFFVIGKHVVEHPEIIEKSYNAGHVIANHTWDHPCMPLISRIERLKQLRRCGKAISKYDTKLYRPPFGHQNMASRFDAYFLGYQAVGWDTDTMDWQEKDPHIIVKNMNEGLHPGTIILMHDCVCVKRERTRKYMLSALEMFLTANSDYQFITIPDLLSHGNSVESKWIRKPNKEQKIRYGVISK